MARSRKILFGSLIATAFAATLLALPEPAAADAYFSYGFRTGGHHSGGHRWRPHYGAGYVWGPPVVVYREAPPQTVYVVPAPTVITQPIPANPASPVYQTTDGRQCREYQRTVFIDGMPQASYGTACLQPDGVWRIVN
ncbi:MAG: hypothetical protein EXQ92_03070 [Alphaproteobacteria bacterium]|nr:hypothetical protein [Alphaproteobacteria bacterium]